MARAEHFDVVVVGARIAGSTLAALLGRLGLRVLLLDKARFPSDTLSTHLIFGDSFGVWEVAGAWPEILKIGAQPMEWIDWRRAPPSTHLRGRVMPVSGHPYMLCLRRILLDAVLFEHAANTPGVMAIEAAKAIEILWTRDCVSGLRYELQGRGERRSVKTDLVVGADGRFSFVGDSVGAPYYNVVPPLTFPFYSYFRNVEPVDPPAFEIWESAEAQGTVMLIPCEGGIWMGVIYTEQSQYEKFRRDHARLFRDRIMADPRIGPRLASAEQIAPVRGRGDMVNFLRVPAGKGWALVGDAGQHKDPLFGQGIGDASRTVRLFARHAADVVSGSAGWDAALAAFHAYRDADLLPKFDFMVRGRAEGVSPEDFDDLVTRVGESEELTRRFLNIFSSGSMVHDIFNAAVLERWKRGLPIVEALHVAV
jgi:2-polyprenyl-6-methoxyphenol hydroxylase-like FAD-dependent oxidoreductase